MDIVEVCEEIKEDMHKIEEDSKKIDCYAILDLYIHLNVYRFNQMLF